MPRLNGRRITWAPAARAIAAVRSAEPSSTTTISMPGSNARISAITPAIAPSSLNAGTIARHRASPIEAVAAGADIVGASSATGAHRRRPFQPDQLEQLLRPPPVGVLVEGALARAAAQLLGLPTIVEQLTVGLDGLVRARHDEQLAARLEPALDPLVRIRHDRRTAAGELERPARGRRVDRRVRAPRDVQVDSRRGDRL